MSVVNTKGKNTAVHNEDFTRKIINIAERIQEGSGMYSHQP